MISAFNPDQQNYVMPNRLADEKAQAEKKFQGLARKKSFVPEVSDIIGWNNAGDLLPVDAWVGGNSGIAMTYNNAMPATSYIASSLK